MFRKLWRWFIAIAVLTVLTCVAVWMIFDFYNTITDLGISGILLTLAVAAVWILGAFGVFIILSWLYEKIQDWRR
jgi:hypothetical protein